MGSRTKRRDLFAALAVLLTGLVVLPVSPAAAEWAGRNGRITFNRDGVNLTANLDGTDVQPLVPADGTETWDGPAAYSADGTKVAFARSSPALGMREIFVADADGTDVRRVTDDQGNDKQAPAWSPDGTRLAIVHGPEAKLSVLQADGSGRVDLGPTNVGRPSFSPDGSTILYYSYSSATGTNEIHTIPAEGGQPTRLTSGAGTLNFMPDWSPDGSQIVFVSNRGCSPYCYERVWAMAADGSNLRLLHADGMYDAAPRWSPDGSAIVFDAWTPDGARLHVVAPDGSGLRRLDLGADRSQQDRMGSWQPLAEVPPATPTASIAFVRDRVVYAGTVQAGVADVAPVISGGDADLNFDGTRLVLSRFADGATGQDLWAIDVDGSDLVQLTDTPDVQEQHPTWSPDGRIAFIQGVSSQLVVMDADGSDRVELPVYEVSVPTFSPDGSTIVYSAPSSSGAHDLWSVPAAGGTPAQLTSSTYPTLNLYPAFSVDGTRIAYTSTRDPDPYLYDRVWVMDADGTDQRLVRPDGMYDRFVHWTPDGDIAFSAWTPDGDRVFTVNDDGSGLRQLDLGATKSTDDWLEAWRGPAVMTPPAPPTTAPPTPSTTSTTVPPTPEDLDPPVISWGVPKDGDVFELGEVALADYSCSDPSGVKVCEGTVPVGEPIDTSTPGFHTFVMHVEDHSPLGGLQYVQASYEVVAPDATPPAIDVRAPADGAVYQLSEEVAADYDCTDPSGVLLCHGSVLGGHVPDGQLLDTSVSGVYAFVVETHDDLDPWNFTSEVVFYSVVAPHGTAATRVEGGGIVTTDPDGLGATEDAPVQTQIVAPSSVTGVITVSPQETTTPAPTGFSMFGTETVLEGPAATATAPYEVSFTVDESVLGGVAPADVQVYRDGAPLTGCTHRTAAVPDPCIVHRGWASDGSDDAVVTVRTSHFSTWSLGRLDYDLSGPSSPLAPAPAVNAGKAGSTIPVKFRLGGDRGLDVLADPSMRLQFDAATGTYTYLWKTTKAMAGTQELVLRFRDGSELRTLHRLR